MHQVLGVHPEFRGESERLGKAFVDQCDLKVHYQFRGLPLAGLAHAEYFLAHRGIKRFQLFDRLLIAADNEQQRAAFRASFRAGHRRIHVLHALPRYAFGKLAGGGG